MEPSRIIFITLGAVIGFVLFLRVWNHFARRYHYTLLATSPCRSCSLELGAECIPLARKKWMDELEAMQKGGSSAVVLSNLELKCPNCGTVNMERDLLALRKQRK